MTEVSNGAPRADAAALLELVRVIAARDRRSVARMLDASPTLAAAAIHVGASREDPETYFLTDIQHYGYAGDTALHIAAAAYELKIAASLVDRGANVRARNRRGAEPIHYAADGIPGSSYWDPGSQAAVINFLVERGADPNAFDKSGVAALHRAVRTRCAAAVRALLERGADPLLANKTGSTPLHLAVRNTGRSSAGSEAAKNEQREIIAVLRQHGASSTDTDARGKTVETAAANDSIRALLFDP